MFTDHFTTRLKLKNVLVKYITIKQFGVTAYVGMEMISMRGQQGE